ncbi:MAG: Verru_Chthon cassette protein D [Prosthecobacter sp.]|nr:Verru_Chthon cassette protein D [Prosthecobacter sp.]
MVMVIAIMAILITLATHSIGSMLASQQLGSSFTRFSNELALASRLAAKENRLVGIRFLKRAEEGAPAEQTQYRAWQFLVPDRTTGKWRPLGKAHLLDASTVMMEHGIYSTLLNHAPLVTAAAVDDADTTPPLFAFKPEGGTTLPRSSTAPKWCVTLALSSDLRRAPDQLPANHRTLVLNAHTGAITEY